MSEVSTITFSISSGGTVSDVVNFRNATAVGLILPTMNAVTSIGFKVGASTSDVASAGMVTLYNTDGTLAVAGAVATGLSGVQLTQTVAGFTALQVVVPTAQTAPRALTLSAKL